MATVLGVVGGSGGVGASTFAGVLAATAASSVLVDLDAAGGGLDVVLGVETVPGARWSGLRVAGGRLEPAVLLGGLPRWGSCAVLAADVAALDPGAVGQVIDAAAASGVAAVVVDLPRAASAEREAAVARCDLVVVVARCDVAGLVAAHAQLSTLPEVPVGVIVRRGSVSPAEAAELVGAPLLGSLPALAGAPCELAAGRVPRRAARLAGGVLDGMASGAARADLDRAVVFA